MELKKFPYILLIFYTFSFSSLNSDDFHTTLKKADRGDAVSQMILDTCI